MCLEEALHSMERETEHVNLLGHPRFIAASYSQDIREMLRVIGFLISEGWVNKVTDQGHVSLTLAGLDQIQDGT